MKLFGLPIVARELRVAARRKSSYVNRSAVAAIALSVAGYLTWVGQAGNVSMIDLGSRIFSCLTWIGFLYSLGTGLNTADSISVEKRDGTLGLLFLTDLSGFEVVWGKLAANSMDSVLGAMGMLPVLSLCLLLGGVGGGDVARSVLVLLNSLFLSLSLGVFVSTLCREERKAMAGLVFAILLLCAGPFAMAYYYASLTGGGGPLDPDFLVLSPVSGMLWVDSSQAGWSADLFRRNQISVHALGWLALGVASLVLHEARRDRGEIPILTRARDRWKRWTQGTVESRAGRRRRLLDRNPYEWLVSRDRLKMALGWIFLVAVGGIWLWSYWRFPDFMMEPVFNFMVLVVLQGYLKVWLASEVCVRLVEDHRTGAFELLLSTPLDIPTILRGQARAARRQFGFLVSVFLGLNIAVFLVARDPGRPGYDHTVGPLLIANGLMLVLDAWAITWVGMWNALLRGKAVRAVLQTVFLVLILPWLFLGPLYVLVFLVLPMILGGSTELGAAGWKIWLGIGSATSLWTGWASRTRLRRYFRAAAVRKSTAGEPA